MFLVSLETLKIKGYYACHFLKVLLVLVTKTTLVSMLGNQNLQKDII